MIRQVHQTLYRYLPTDGGRWKSTDNDIVVLGTLIRAYDEFRDRAGRVLEGRGSKTTLVEAAVARRAAPVTLSQIEIECPGVSRDMIRHVLRGLRAQGVLRVEGRGPGARWIKVQ